VADKKKKRLSSDKQAINAGQGRMARMSDVARIAGVTAMTVSRALRTPEKVSAETRKRVAEAVRNSGFIPNYAARSLVAQRSQIIVALFPTILNSVFSGTIEGLSRVLAENGYYLLLGETNFDIKTEEKLLSGFVGWRPAGILLTGSEHTVATRTMLMNVHAPVIELWNLPKKPFDIAVGFSNFEATYKMTCSLFEWGYRRIAFMYLNFPQNDRSTDRRNGYRAAVRDLGLPRDSKLEMQVPFGVQAGRDGLRVLLKNNPDIDVVLCASDTLAVGALMETLRMGRRVPEELAIAGFGDVELAAELVPSLTTVQLPRAGMAQATAQVLMERIAGTYTGPKIIDCGFSIVRRESA
jgi:LacI family transcriptional regulator, gluconate utilization system Gnt-I transcriptional repressor